ncbi:hypothetical protein [Actinoplanes siamensis]|uniref:Uncharacterized protein n=1 Tax=Actinoplanes siamensis TaxID=1223317 RepID=A0A919TIS0_9ACTN|nr:hypothetical protein [Actinoplanes siamensis]GIF03940.1 hypothetical protein Asi03nite_14780 [Actinoplanes siamensis]
MNMKLAGIAAAAVAAVALAGVAVTQMDHDDRRASSMPDIPFIDQNVPDHQLLQDVIEVVTWRESGEANHFAYVPKDQPPSLTGLHIGGNGDAITDTYEFGAGLQAIAAFAQKPMGYCDTAPTGGCAKELTIPGDGAPTQYLSVYFVGVTAESQVDLSQHKFWKSTEIVPVSQARWFTDLVARAKASTVD